VSRLGLVKRPTFDDWPCSVARVADVLGDPWTILLVRDASHGLTRFEEFQRSLNIPRNTLSARLRRLVEIGLLERRLYQDYPPRAEYVLTDMGRDFFPVLTAMLGWGDRWLGEDGAPVSVHHVSCGHDIDPQVVCRSCGRPVDLDEVEFRLGPGYPDDVPEHLDLRDRFARRVAAQDARGRSASDGPEVASAG